MICVILALALGPIQFVEQDLPWLDVPANFRLVDFDGDGTSDLLLPRHVVFARGGALSKSNAVEIPNLDGSPLMDVWGNILYLRFPDRLEMVKWQSGAFQRTLVQPMQWPAAGDVPRRDELKADGSDQAPELGHFLYDLNGDKVPEIVLPVEDGLHVYQFDGASYAEKAVLQVYPTAWKAEFDNQSLWPDADRRISLPTLSKAFNVMIDKRGITVLSDTRVPGQSDLHQYTESIYSLDSQFKTILGETKQFGPMPSYVAPVRLNQDDVVDFAGEGREDANLSSLPVTVQVITASADAGKTWITVRSRFTGICNLYSDVDGDGREDLLSEDSGLLDGGMRESISRLLTATTITHSLMIRRQDSSGKFSATPDWTAHLNIVLDEPPFRQTKRLTDYWVGELLSMDGDFDGDGWKDLAIHDRPDRIAVFRFTKNGFARKPFAILAAKSDWKFSVADVDGDHRADLIVYWYDHVRAHESGNTRVYLTRGSEP